jgi:acetoin utilization deacetylase AcuC-like enzyme
VAAERGPGAIRMPVVWSEQHRLHEPGGEVWVGIRTPGTELPERAERIRAELEARTGSRIVAAQPHPDDAVLAVHEPELLEYLATAWRDWQASGLTSDPGQDRVVPYVFPHPGLLAGVEPSAPRLPASPAARAGRFAYDTMTLIGPGTWEAARGAVDAALTAADLVAAGAPAAYACCRPPGHHATRTSFGGSCYLNNAAAAAAALQRATGERVGVIDIDAHHGNGTQSIFYAEPSVLTASVHVDPGAGWFPHFLGFAGEQGAGAGAGSNRNVPLPPGTTDGPWVEAISGLASWIDGAGVAALVVALGVDAATGDPESPLQVSEPAFHAAGRVLGMLGLPTVVVQEGGYETATIGPLVSAALEGIESASPSRSQDST